MAFGIDEFLAKGLPLNGARPSQFYVELSPPPILGYNSDSFKFACKAASIPPEIIGQVPVAYFGRYIKVNGDREFPDWTVTVNNDANWLIRKMMQAWSQAMNYHVSNVMESNVWPMDYKRSASVTQMRQDGATIATYEFYGLFPTMVGDIVLGWEDMNAIEQFDITFAYDYWIMKEGDNLASTSADGTAENVIPPISNA